MSANLMQSILRRAKFKPRVSKCTSERVQTQGTAAAEEQTRNVYGIEEPGSERAADYVSHCAPHPLVSLFLLGFL